MDTISWEQFQAVDLRVGTIIEADKFPEARKPAYKLTVNFGDEIGIKKSSAQITEHYTTEDLVGKQVIGVVNLPDKQIGPFMSECLVTGFYDENEDVILATPEDKLPNGKKLC
ncbi:tRNA-binding protein [Fodinibius salinus]|uniref:tRNA-binding protein n=1 Tax=Fodinibius salinus TaxID=860790 RepID=A0A5D3YJS2_9BACT|nr:tRNA-binding protein [Fodinibius salinus]TYP94094.1 tRNA-binding protein [Fodinibius salinus]